MMKILEEVEKPSIQQHYYNVPTLKKEDTAGDLKVDR
jgi:hypothetical protein